MSFFGNRVAYRDGANLDAFGRLRVSAPVPVLQVQCQYDADPLQLETGATGTGVAGVHSASNRMLALSASAGTGTSYAQTYEYAPYGPGISTLSYVGCVMGSGTAGAVIDVGLFDAANGIFLRQNGASGLQIVRRTSASGAAVNNAVAQSSWNLDALNGAGKSGLTLDPSKALVLVIDAQALGRVRVGFALGGEIVYAHEFDNANAIALPWAQSVSLPVQMLLTATSIAAGVSCYFHSGAVLAEGAEAHGYAFATPEMTVTAASGAATHILGIRPATTFNSIANRARLRIESVEVEVTGGTVPVQWQLVLGATFSAGPTWGAVNSSYSGVEYTSAVGTLSASGLIVQSGYCAPANFTRVPVTARHPLTLDRAGAVRAYGSAHLLVAGIGGTAATRATINFTEIR